MDMRSYKSAFLIAKVVFVLVLVASITAALTSCLSNLVHFPNMNWNLLTIGFLGCLVYRVSNAHGWSFVLQAIGQQLPPLLALRVWLTSEACRWIPGSVWSYGSRAYQARRYGLQPLPAGASLFLELILTIAAWFFTAIVGLVAYRSAFATLFVTPLVSTTAIALAVLLLVIVLLMLAWKSLSHLLAAKFKKLHKQISSLGHLKLDSRRVSKALVYYVAMCFLNGIVLYCVLIGIAPEANVPVLAVIGGNALAWLIGFFAFVAPGGLVVREGALAALLTVWLPAEKAFGVAIIWRIVQIVVEVVCMFGAYLPNIISYSRKKDPLKKLFSGVNCPSSSAARSPDPREIL